MSAEKGLKLVGEKLWELWLSHKIQEYLILGVCILLHVWDHVMGVFISVHAMSLS
jgi:hypothetical protein